MKNNLVLSFRIQCNKQQDPERRDGPKKVLRNIIGRCITYNRNIKNLPFSLQITSIKSIINRVDRKMNKKDNENIAIFSIPAKKKKKIWR